ncbi:MAG: S16 family serine protease [Candidatus Vecturithrix sp.]|nr:S16 family serine protease [Candidatus Vecturithrix sp.]
MVFQVIFDRFTPQTFLLRPYLPGQGCPKYMTIFALRNAVIYPHITVPIFLTGEDSMKLVEEAVLRQKLIGIVTQKAGEAEEPTPEDLYDIGTVARVLKVTRPPEGGMFIATANILSTIPAPLLDRMEVIEIAAICRGVAKQIVDPQFESLTVSAGHVPKYLGPIKYFSEIAERTVQPGVATGLAWTSVGGDILFVEAAKMKGHEKLILTGKLGAVMKESAEIALSYLRSKARDLGIPENFIENTDIHLHVPSGAIPKDGPSAGVTLYTSLASLFKNVPVRHDVAMTGEVALRGNVLPVGGIKEKVLAAHNAGVKHIILPAKNEKDLDEIPTGIKANLSFHFVRHIDDVLQLALVNPN